MNDSVFKDQVRDVLEEAFSEEGPLGGVAAVIDQLHYERCMELIGEDEPINTVETDSVGNKWVVESKEAEGRNALRAEQREKLKREEAA